MTASLLPIPDDPRLARLLEMWPAEFQAAFPLWPRSAWLKQYEKVLREFYPQANSASLKLTARHAAPFFLAAGPNVP